MEGKKKLVLALVWQMVRKHTLDVLGNINEEKLLQWALNKVTKEPKIHSFKDPTIKNCQFFFNLLEALNPEAIDRENVAEGANKEEIEKNAKYLISVARKMGALTYVVWEDIVDVRPRMVLLFVAAICALERTSTA
eukprot:TRINITY_DN0_c3674_g1_i2.p1 TRINITY_DN0_c3674_g1~~TRINITY_DN0_c3674_g1_i2.p1  ORF type:complete len:136 (+),score=47.89 TRINITY_DN0_c3674_g1_i2:45-452(+)